MTFETWFQSSHPKIPTASADAVLRLTAEGATLPFIARYRKEQTGNLDEVAIQAVIDAKEKWDTLLKRQAFVVEQIEQQGKLTPELKEKILSTFEPQVLEDIYLPFKQKRKSKATLAKEAGLEALADWLWSIGRGTEKPQPGQTLELWAFTFRNEEKGFKDAASAIQGALDILIERLSEKAELRQLVRDSAFQKGHLKTRKGEKAKANSKYENYFDYHEPVQSLLKPENSHRYLAVRRGWMEEELVLSIGGEPSENGGDSGFEETLQRAFESEACPERETAPADVRDALLKAARFAFKVHVFSSIENEVHKALKEVADEAAIKVFAENVRKLLLASPFGPKAVLGVDPGVRTGCKLAVVDDSGRYVASTVIHLQTDDGKAKAKELLTSVVQTGNLRAIAVGNGTAGRETEIFIRASLKDAGLSVPVVMVNEAGASVYSASEAAREEFPELDVTVRGAISIARRLQDPLAELVKIDPKSIGVGQYQHDVSPHSLKKSLELVVDSCVNQVGVNLNTASYHLLAHVSGIGESLAKAIVEHRGSKGLFKSRQQLLDVPRFSRKAFEQAAGFLRIPDAENPLDNTGVHPERYEALDGLAGKLGKSVKDFMGAGIALLKQAAKDLKGELGEFTFNDIIQELEKPGRDPREEFVPFQYREDIHELKDLKPDMICPGIVTNVTNFGAFVDIGVHQDGLVHISQLAGKFVKDPRDVVSPGDRVQVKVLEIHLEKSQISLSIKAALEATRPQRDFRERGERRQPRGERAQDGHASGGRHAHGQGHGDGQRRPHGQGHGHGGKPGGKPGERPHGGKPAHKPPKPKEAFNNAFAGLASLRDSLKAK